MPQEATELKERLESYRQTLGTLGMRDYQVGGVEIILQALHSGRRFFLPRLASPLHVVVHYVVCGVDSAGFCSLD